MEDTLKFIDDVIAEYNERMKSQPYQINLLEEVHMHEKDGSDEQLRMKENAHSRILRSILAFRRKGDPVLLKSLIEYIVSLCPDSQWKKIDINHPAEPRTEDSTEDGRIDLFIEEPYHYAIIFENKINEVGDQPNQLARYINHERKRGYKEHQIYVVYLSSNGHEPSEQSWIDPETRRSYKESYLSRYVNLSYKNVILPWIKNRAKPIVEKIEGEQLLASALCQYVNYLEIKYKIREIDHMKDDIMMSALGFTPHQSDDEKISIIQTKLNSFIGIKNSLVALYRELLQNKYPHLSVVDEEQYQNLTDCTDFAFSFTFNESIYYVVLYWYNKGRDLHCGVFPQKGEVVSSELAARFSFLSLSKAKTRLFHRRNLSSYSDYLIDRVFSLANEIANER